MTTRTYRVPAKFWHDHDERSPCDRPEQMATLISTAGRSQVAIQANAEQLECLRSDAAFYAEGNVDDCASLVRSAKATLEAIARGPVDINP